MAHLKCRHPHCCCDDYCLAEDPYSEMPPPTGDLNCDQLNQKDRVENKLPTFLDLAKRALDNKGPREKNITIKIEALTARMMIDNETYLPYGGNENEPYN